MVMNEHRTLKRLGRKLREESRDIVEARVPERLRALLDRLASPDNEGELNSGHASG
jgi:hypothetical protein